MNSDTNIAAHLSIGPKVDNYQNFTGFLEFFFSFWYITVGMLKTVVYFRLGLKYLITLKKVKLLYINYCNNCIHSLLQHLHS